VDDTLMPIRSAIAALRFDWYDLEQQMVRSGAQVLGLTGRPTPDGGSVPINLGVLALQEQIWWLATAWEEPVREAAGLSMARRPVARHHVGVQVISAINVLAAHVVTLLALSAVTFCGYLDLGDCERTGADGVADLVWTHRLARQMLGLTRRIRHMYGICPICRRSELCADEPERAGAAVTVYCGHCDHRMTENDYQDLLRSMVVRS
jgi:hypothetical protein